MSTELLESKLSDLTRRLEILEASSTRSGQPAWEAIAGRAQDDDLLEEAMRLGAEWRARVNADALPSSASSSPAA